MSSNEVGPWALDKLERLGKYLSAYTRIMRKQSWCEGFYYIDAFAGPGGHEIRSASVELGLGQMLFDASHFVNQQDEQKKFITGSPRIALEIEHPFSGYIFVEKNPERIQQLEHLKLEYGETREIRIRQEECNQYLLETVVNNSRVDWRSNRAVVFLDPFGMQVPWETLSALASTNAIEVFLNFPVGMAIQRLLLRKPNNFTDDQRTKLDNYFGSPDWFNVLYKPEKTLFGEQSGKVERSGEALLKWYQGRLKSIFGYVSAASLIRNTKGGHLYYLLLASPNETGAKIANRILSAGEAVRFT